MASFASLSGASVLRGCVTLPFSGAWHATLTLDTDVPPTGAVTLTLDEGAVALAGTVVRSREVFGRVELLLVGGAGRLATEVEPRHYRSVTASLVWQAILSESGEASSSSSDAALLGRQLTGWTRLRGSAASALTLLASALGGTWRVGVDGAVLLTTASAEVAGKVTGTRIEDSPAESSALWALDTHGLLPGMRLDGRRVLDVEHTIREDGIRTRAWYG